MEAGLSADTDIVYCFGKHRFAPRRQLLICGNTPVRIGTRALDLLQLLIERQGEVVSKSDLLRFAWPDTFVHESNLKVNIAALRRVLCQDPDELPYIVNVAGRGYRFAVPARLEKNFDETLTAPPGGQIQNNLPALASPIGRDDDIAALAATLDARGFVTVVGPAGVGKTTLAVATARQMAERHSRDVCFVDLAAINDPQLVCAAITSALGLSAGLADLLTGIVAALRSTNRLLILDNCEHVLPTAALVAEHIRVSVPQIGIIATSREPLRLRSEIVYRLSPLQYPARDTAIDAAQAMAFPAVALFMARAKDASNYCLSDHDAPVVVDICRRVDGVPLAIELAASRLAMCDTPSLLRQLDQSFEILNHGPRTAPLRHQALQTTLDWSYRLLSDAEASLLRLLSVFAGLFTADDLQGLAHELGGSPGEIVTCMEGLVSKSLVSQNVTGERRQYRLLDVTRTYAHERLQVQGEYRRACEAHARYLGQLFEQAEAEWTGRPRAEWLAVYGPRANDLRKAIDWAFSAGGDTGLGIRLTTAAITLWDELSSISESSQRVSIALEAARCAETCDPVPHVKLATAYARSLAFADRLEPNAEFACRESVRLAETSGNTEYHLRAVWALAVLQSFAGRHRDVTASLDRLDDITARSRNGKAEPAIERFRCMTQFYRGGIIDAHDALTQLALRHDRNVQTSHMSRFQIAPYVVIQTSLAFVSWVRGNTADAVTAAMRAIDNAAASGHVMSESNALALAAIPIAIGTGNLATAERHLARLTETLNQKGLTSWWPLSRFLHATIQHQRGHSNALDDMRIAMDEILSSGFLLRAPAYLGMLAEAALDGGDVGLARSSIAAALVRAAQQDEAWCQPELLRIRGRVEERLGKHVSAEETLHRAFTLAGQTGALSFQLRTACDLADRWAKTGRHRAAIALLEPICRRLTSQIADRDADRAMTMLDRIRDDDRSRLHKIAISPSRRPRRPGLAME